MMEGVTLPSTFNNIIIRSDFVDKKQKTVENTLLNSEKEVEVEVGNTSFILEPLVRAEYKPLMNVFAEVLMSFDLDILDNIEDNIGTLVNIISERALMELYKTHLKKAAPDTEITADWINNNMTMSQEMDLFTGICKVNNIEQMIKNFTQTIQALGAIRQASNQQVQQAGTD